MSLTLSLTETESETESEYFDDDDPFKVCCHAEPCVLQCNTDGIIS